MLKEFGKEDWLGLLAIPADMVPSALILRGTRNLQHHYRRYAAHFSQIVELGSSTGFLEDVFIGKMGDAVFAYASVYGGSMASEIVHIFGSIGTKAVIQTGCCGAIEECLEIGDLIAAKSAFTGEGVAPYYSDKQEFAADFLFNDEEFCHLKAGANIKHRRVFTTAALMAEGRQEIEDWRTLGFDAVDMETAAVFSVAESFEMRKGSMLFVSDLPYSNKGLLHDNRDEAMLKYADDKMVDLVLTFLQSKNSLKK